MLQLRRITFFVEDLDAATRYYGGTLGIDGSQRDGWSAFPAAGGIEVAFHRGRGRRPRLEYVTADDLDETRRVLNEAGARLGPIKEVAGRRLCSGKDPDGNTVQISADIDVGAR